MTSTPSCRVLNTVSSCERSRARRWTRLCRFASSSWSSRPSTLSIELCILPAMGSAEERQLALEVTRLGEEFAQEAVAMHGAATALEDRVAVLLRAVALVLRKTVTGMLLVQLVHHPVARHLGHDRGHRDAQRAGITAHDALVRIWKIAQGQAVDQDAAGHR